MYSSCCTVVVMTVVVASWQVQVQLRVFNFSSESGERLFTFYYLLSQLCMKEELLLVTVPPPPPFQNCRWRCRRKIVRSAAVCDGLKVENRKRFLVHWWQWWRQIKLQKEGKKVLRNYQQVFAISAEAFRKRIYIDGGSNGHDFHLHNDDEPYRFESQLKCKC